MGTKRLDNPDLWLMPPGDFAEMTVTEWGQHEWDAGRANGIEIGRAAVLQGLLEAAADYFTMGEDDKAKWLRGLVSALKMKKH